MTGSSDGLQLAIAADHDASADADAKAQASLAELEAVKRWQKRIDEAREFDKDARAGYAKDRTYCANRANEDVFDVRVPIAGTYVGVLTTFLYARNPETSVEVSEAVSPRVREDAKAIAKTLELVITRLWERGKLKHAANQMVRSALSVGIGWIKAAWYRETARNPEMDREIDGLRENLNVIERLQRERAARGEQGVDDADKAELEARLRTAEDQVERVVFNGLCVDFTRAEDIQVAMECPSLEDYAQAPWIAHRLFKAVDKAKADYPGLDSELGCATAYYAKPAGNTPGGAGFSGDGTADDADAYSKSTGGAVGTHGAHLCIWEVWDKDTGQVYTIAEGCPRYLRPPFVPSQRTRRFYPFFQLGIAYNDGERHPQSLVDRSRELLDEYDRTRTNYRLHRRRAIPKTGFDAGALDTTEAAKLEGAVTSEMVGLNLNGQRPDQVVFPISYNAIDPALYDTSVIRSELEMIWGVQEALSSSIRTAKTATEADIQQQGTESRLGFMRDALDDLFTVLAAYTGELAISPQGLTEEDATTLAGEEMLWVSLPDPEFLDMLVLVQIRAGSSGKPSTALRQQQWSMLLPQLSEAAIQIGQMRGSPPSEVAACLEQLAVETVRRVGDTSIDPYSFIPQSIAPPPAPSAGPGGALPDALSGIDPAVLPDPSAAPAAIPAV